MSLMNAAEARKLTNNKNKPNEEGLKWINDLIQEAIESGDNKIFLHFDKYGYDYGDVDFLKYEYGYEVMRNGPCLWWEISW